ncbi:MAG: AAA family ATPase [Gammaproteobacteria bacterium]
MADPPPVLTVIAGTNGAGKSSIVGQYIRQHGGDYFNPDEWAQVLRARDSTLSQTDANSLAWQAGTDMLESAIEEGRDHVFETTLGGNTIPLLIGRAAAQGHRVVIWYVGLDSPETHLRRVRARVQRGGHDIPEDKIRERFERSIENLVTLVPHIHELKLFDNTAEADLAHGEAPGIRALLHMRDHKIVSCVELTEVPDWAKPVFLVCLAR